MSKRAMQRAGRGPSTCPCCSRSSVAVLCPACGRPIAHVRCTGTRRRWSPDATILPEGDLWIDPVYEYRATGRMGLERIGTDPDTGIAKWGVRAPRITLFCTRACGATPSRRQAAIVAAARRCLEAGLTEFRLPS